MNFLKTVTTILFIFAIQIAQSQIIVNQSWVNSTGEPDLENFPLDDWDKITWSNSTLDPTGNLITVGNTLQSPGNTDILITKYDNNGQQLWQHTVDGQANGHDYGTAVTTDIQGNVYVAGATSTLNSLLDFTLLKYNSLGVLQWTNNWSGSSNLYDVPTSIKVDASGNVAVAGITVTASLQSDIVAQKYNTNGTLVWTSFYDNVGLNELPVSVDFVSGGKVAVIGFTNAAAGIWGLVDVRFSDQTGTLSTSNVTGLPQVNIEDAFAIVMDNFDNIYIAGSSNSVNDKNFEVIKVNNSFNVEWSNQFDGKGQHDIAKAIAIDSDNNIIVSGNSNKPTGGTDILTIKITPSGQEIWRRSYMAPVETGEAKVSKIQVSTSDEVFLAGTVDGEDGKDFATFMYDNKGAIRMEQIYNSGANNKDVLTDFQVFNDEEIYLTGTSEIAGYGVKYTTAKYDLLRKTNGNVLEGGKPHHLANELIVKFLPQEVNTTFVDDRTKLFGNIYDVLPTDVIEDINKRLTTTLDRAQVIKIYHRLTTATTTSTTRLDEEIKMPEFWSTFLLVFPSGTDIEPLITELNAIPEHVLFAHYNHVFTLDVPANDTYYVGGSQSSLIPNGAFPSGHINVEPAWDYETGKGFTKVGVYDTEIFWGHADFGNGTLAGSQITGGWDFFDNISIGSVTNPSIDHGTHAAGIVGALRDNMTGVAGIAGGGLDGTGAVNAGVQLFSMAIGDWQDCNGDGLITPGFVDCDGDGNAFEFEIQFNEAAVAPAITEGAAYNASTGYGYGLHVTNHSYSGSDWSQAMRNAVFFSFQNQCTFVASRGNGGTDDLAYPACYTDEWVINVGASGTDGLYKDLTNGDLDPMGTSNWSSSWGGDVDFIAPGVSELITTLDNAGNVDFPGVVVNGTNICTIGAAGYDCFNGTSASAPHVAGVAALMFSKHHPMSTPPQPNGLAPEDIEFLLEKYASDFPTYQDLDGFGLIDAAEAVERVSAPCWQVFHSGEPSSSSESTVLDETIQLVYSIGSLSAGYYIADRIQVTQTFLDVFPPGTEVEDSWGRTSSTTGVSAQSPVSGFPYAGLEYTVNQSAVAVTATTYAWHVTETFAGQNVDVWIPALPEDLIAAYSLHLKFPSECGVSTSTDNIDTDSHLSVKPNPTSNTVFIDWKLDQYSEPQKLSLYDINGKLLLQRSIAIQEGREELDLSEYPSGVYFVKLSTLDGNHIRKIIKQ